MKDPEFLMANKIVCIVNCVGHQVENQWESLGISYLTFFLDDSKFQATLSLTYR